MKPHANDHLMIQELSRLQTCYEVAEWLQRRIGGRLEKSQNSESAYLHTIWGSTIRISCHVSTKDPIKVQPLHVINKKLPGNLLICLRFAVVAAMHGGLTTNRKVRRLYSKRNTSAGRRTFSIEGLIELTGF